jgi:hypothetical protein
MTSEDIYINMGVVLRGDILRLKEIMQTIAMDFSDVNVIYQKTDGSKLKIVSISNSNDINDDAFTT